MKKYRIIILFFISISFAVLVINCSYLLKHKESNSNYYRVEINRSKHDFESYLYDSYGMKVYEHKFSDDEKKELNSFLTDNKDKYSSIEKISFLDISTEDVDNIKNFYEPVNKYQVEVLPVILKDEKIIGYLRFDYKKTIDRRNIIIFETISFSLLSVAAISLLFFTYHRIMKPFNNLSNMPYELAKGNLNGELKESKQRYFGKFIWGISMLRDTLEYHKNKELKLAHDKKMILLSISHDIKTPLNAINLYSKALEEGIYSSEEERIEAVKNIQKKTAEIDGFVKDIIKSSTEDVVNIEVVNSEFYIEDLVKKIKSAYEEKCKIKKMEFTIENYENHLVKGDIDRLYEAICNLVENAFKYGDGKKISIMFNVEEYCQLITVYNSGKPVTDNEINHLFDSFYRGSNVGSKAGNGLGLYICKEIMKKMQGDIFAEKESDGMKFTLVCKMC